MLKLAAAVIALLIVLTIALDRQPAESASSNRAVVAQLKKIDAKLNAIQVNSLAIKTNLATTGPPLSPALRSMFQDALRFLRDICQNGTTRVTTECLP